ncbi:HAD family hydrolase [Streptoalloteichus hindustanus]|uniref:Putative hydrolase of the HAD superfamily n=1 Tax=Streptoalloteichus hindustanus TaxID=2017 RepID=A0A1M5GQZ8_STRHI|nr:HAD family hydrolase [Streptoalloteichus hindustanus]SHG06175.1 putative hydrolase of the HAD superfamily [Streptoalloteichus hindustanus]
MTSALATDIPERTTTTPIRAVCLDIDDTLVDYGQAARIALETAAGRDDAWPVWERANAHHFARLLAGEVDYETMRRDRARTFYDDLGERLDDAGIAERESRRQFAMERSWQLYGDTLPCLDWLRAAGLRLAAVTNASGAHQRAKLAVLGLTPFFDYVAIAGELRTAKPEPVIFHTACLALGVDPAETVHVGDRLDLDAVGARDAGLHGVWLDRAATRTAPPSGVSVITTLAELPELLVCDLELDLAPAAPVGSR